MDTVVSRKATEDDDCSEVNLIVGGKLFKSGGGIEARPRTEKRRSHNLQSGPVKTWTAVFVIINISDR